ncbi:Uncharacterised protein [Mycobacteroides abscessus subsp. bolletii]|nr:Uncharacterised protein [Mycobacteroides abscessus]SKF61082.1 Uncharacterised protein [Mycobacteroides abscessus subsp. bolletii]SKH64658.1 Uncharacterised protein [Mycobacteroides abscessus subsp. bolletii]
MFTTPRRLRRNSLMLLLIWLAVAVVHHNGVVDDARHWQLPTTVGPPASLHAPHTPSGP